MYGYNELWLQMRELLHDVKGRDYDARLIHYLEYRICKWKGNVGESQTVSRKSMQMWGRERSFA